MIFSQNISYKRTKQRTRKHRITRANVIFNFKINDTRNYWTFIRVNNKYEPSHEKKTICICENKDADQLCSYNTADQRLCFRQTDSTIHFLLIPKVSSFQLYDVTVQPGLCRTWSEPKLLVFSRTGSNILSRRARNDNR